jgi:sugar phosphate isomerase/epimerase
MDLGVLVTIETPEFAGVVFRKVKQAGVDFGLVNFVWSPLSADIVKQVAESARANDFTVKAVSCPTNLLRLSEASSSGSDVKDLHHLIQNMALFEDCRHVVLWSGTYARKWNEPNLLNQGEDAYFAFVFELQGLMGTIAYSTSRVAITPCYAHVLHDLSTSLRIGDDFPDGRVSLCFSPAHLISPTLYPKRNQILPQIIAALAPSADIVMVGDILINEDLVARPIAGKGGLSMQPLVAALKKNASENAIWLLDAHPSFGADELEEARNLILKCAQEVS